MIKSVIWSSMLDYPGHVCTTLFFEGCNFSCEYCHNKEIGKEKTIDFKEEILPKLLERKPMINHIILSGGECTISTKVQEIVDKLYENGFYIGLHTNGYNIEFLEKNKEKINYIGMDIKTSFEKYNQIVNNKIDIEKIKRSINFVIQDISNYEFRTTIYPKFVTEQDCIKIAKYLGEKKAKRYVLQQYQKVEGIDVEPIKTEEILEIQLKCQEFVKTKVRGLIK